MSSSVGMAGEAASPGGTRRHVHDLNEAAIATTHGAHAIVTANTDDFAGLPEVTALTLGRTHVALAGSET